MHLHFPIQFFTWSKEQQFKTPTAAATAAKLLQSCPTLCDPIDGSPPGSPVPGILQARTLERVAISSSNAGKGKVKVKSLSCDRLFPSPWAAAHQAPPSMEFSRQEYWSGLPLPSPKTPTSLCKKFKLIGVSLGVCTNFSSNYVPKLHDPERTVK